MNNFAWLKKESAFFDLFPEGRVPIKNILVPNQARLEGSDETEVYMVDFDRVPAKLRLALATRIATTFNNRVEEVLAEMQERGMPIRASQVTVVSSDSRAFL